MLQLGFFDWQKRLDKPHKNGGPLVRIKQVVAWELFRPELEKLREKEGKSNAGARARVKAGLRNLAYSMNRFRILLAAG